ncbi:hypothetical protein BDV12DRAFT_190939 [Aspergillus spectabilis]
MKFTTYLASACAVLATSTTTYAAPTEISARATQGEVFGKPCYCGDDCTTYSWLEGWEWAEGGCLNFFTGLASAWAPGTTTCKFYSGAGCTGSWTSSTSTCSNSPVGWIWSAQCYVNN